MGDVLTYADEITAAMTWLGEQPDTVFLGQGVRYPGHGMFRTLAGVPMEKRLEMPVAEDMQMGMSIGLAMTGKTVISIYPRMDFLLCAMNQLVNHLDKNLYALKGRVIIRAGIGATSPMDPGAQHCGDYTTALTKMLKRIPVMRPTTPVEVAQAYKMAFVLNTSLIVEEMNKY